jgi:hypothetical protein
VGKFFADRGTHLAAMIAYFALLSFVPLTFIALSLLGLTRRADESSFLVKEIKRTLPGTPIDRIVALVTRCRTMPPRSGSSAARPCLDLAVALQRARVGLQHRVRAAEPLVPAREGLATLLMVARS